MIIEGEKGIDKEEDEEISFNFDKIKNLFKRRKKPIEEKKTEEPAKGEEQFDIKGVLLFLGKYKKFLIPLIIILFAVYLSIDLRITTLYLPATDDWAKNNVYSFHENRIRQQIESNYPNLPENNKNRLVEEEFTAFLKKEKTLVAQQVNEVSNYFKSTLQDEHGKTYLPDIDPYFWIRHAKNVIENGHPGDEMRENVSLEGYEIMEKISWDTHMNAPIGRPVPNDMFHAYFEAYLFKFVHFFNKDATLKDVVFYVPILICVLAILPAFFIGKRIHGNISGAMAAIVMAIHPALLVRTISADTDAYTVLYPLLVTWLFLEAFNAKKTATALVLTGLAGFFVGLFSFTWGGWWFIFDFLLTVSFFCIFYYGIVYRSELKNGVKHFIKQPVIKNTLIITGTFMVCSVIFTVLFTDWNTFKIAPTSPLAFSKIKQVAITTVWPNVFTTVAEQNPASLDRIISDIGFGTWFFFLIPLVGIMWIGEEKRKLNIFFMIGSILWFIIVLAIRPQDLILFLVLINIPIIIKFVISMKNEETKLDAKIPILLMLWLTASIYAATKGIRFGILAIPAFIIAFGITTGMVYRCSNELIAKGLRINKTAIQIVLVILLFLPLISVYKNAKDIASVQVPLMNDAWYSSLTKIKTESQPDAIITSWWDFGHWFKMVADRAVTFDGTSQDSPNAHWIGSVLLTDDEDYAVGILRMVDCGQNNAFEELNKVIKDEPKSISITEEIVRLDKDKARSALLNKGLGEEEANTVLKYTHCDPPDGYFITSEDMVGKAGVWAHFGSWDFDRALAYNTLQKKEYKNNLEKSTFFLKEQFNYSDAEATSVYYEVNDMDSEEANRWIAPWPSYIGGMNRCSQDNNTIFCPFIQGTTVEVDKETLDANIKLERGILTPDSLAFVTKEGMEVKKFNNSIGFGITLLPDDEGYLSISTFPGLEASMFTRLFYAEGHGLSHFKKFSDERGINSGRIIVWKIDWEGKEKNMLDVFKINETIQNESKS